MTFEYVRATDVASAVATVSADGTASFWRAARRISTCC